MDFEKMMEKLEEVATRIETALEKIAPSPLPPAKPEIIMKMDEVKSILRYGGQGGLYRLIHDDPNFRTFTIGGAGNGRRMLASSFREWIKRRMEIEDAGGD